MEMPPPSRDSIVAELETALGSSTFQGAERSKVLLRFLVEQTLGDRADRLKEYTIGAEALGKGDSFDPRSDPIVRAEASRLRSRLERYYATEGQTDPVVIALPKGSYVPQFRHRARPADAVEGPIAVPRSARSVGRDRLVWLASGVAAGVLAMAWWITARGTAIPDRPLMQFEIELTSGGVLGSDVGTDVTLSPDGTRIVFVARAADGIARLFTRRLDQPRVSELAGTDGALNPFFSPDGEWVGFWASGSLKKTAIDGGSPLVLCDTANFLGGSWGEDGYIVAALSFGKLARVPSASGLPTVLADLTSESIDPRWPQVLPGAKQVLFTAVGPPGPNGASIEALSLTDGARKVLVRGGTFGRYLSNGYLIYVNQGTLFAVRFDLAQMQVSSGTPIPLLDDVLYSFTFGFAQLDVSRTGTLVYRRSTARIAEWIDGAGRTEPLLTTPGQYIFPTLSRAGTRLAVAVTESGTSIVQMYERQRDRWTRVNALRGEYFPLWSPDGRVLILGSISGLHWVMSDGVAPPKPLTRRNAIQIPWSFTPDGTRLAYHERSASTGFDLWTVPVHATDDGLKTGEPELFLQTPAYETYPAFSPDGRWIAYGSGEYGKWEVYVRPFPNNGAREVQVSQGGGRIPHWLPNGHELLYRTDDQRLMVATYTIHGGAFVAEEPRPWWPGQLADTGVLSNFDLDLEGRRVLALLPATRLEGRQSPNHVTVTLNFSDEVRRRTDGFQK
jgi:hypothetical protein